MFQRISLEIVAKKFEKIFTVDLTLTTYCQINCEYFIDILRGKAEENLLFKALDRKKYKYFKPRPDIQPKTHPIKADV